jgi:hypothetical protein
MRSHLRGRVVAAVVVLPLVAAMAAACGDNDKEKAKENAGKPCPSSINGTATDQLPSGVPVPTGASTPYLSSSQGATKVWFFALNGSPDQLPSLRDSYDTQLQSEGYTIKGTDQEAGAEAESEFSGPHDGTTNFQPLCQGKVNFRLKLES